ncbi:hypothetical protein [Hyphomonas chukchiensis]|uniref:Uncharacterized protein n=1 Tax=Hyphomonas chukchiensis TaxID=1280947 RepID=A0A062UN39_9PROT|nr:hypothetical protein [Hyphomonas chukchiensis]KCZ61299.1 hypothetical protein HY30_02855 [Hyphomonas chukchiensis]
MSRDVDERKKRAALRKLRKAAALAEQGLGPELSDWERQFLEEVEQRIETYGSAFADPEKGAEGDALSALQRIKLKEIDKKARGKGGSGFKSKSRPAYTPRVRNVDAEAEEAKGEDTPPPPPPAPSKPRLVSAALPPLTGERSGNTPPTPPARPSFRVIEGGKANTSD